MKPLCSVTALTSALLLMATPGLAQNTTPAEVPPAAPAETTPAAPAETTPAAPAELPPAEVPTEVPATPAPAETPTSASLPAGVVAPEGYVPVTDFAVITADEVKGTDLRGPEDASLGTISDVELGGDGAITGVIADIGGFLGIGSHTVKLGLSEIALYRHPEGGMIAWTAMDKDTLKALPEYVAPAG